MEESEASLRDRRVIEDERSSIPVIHVLREETSLRRITLLNVPSEDWGFSAFDGTSCQLNATCHPGPQAELIAEINFSGQCVFDCEVLVESPLGYGVTFGLGIHDAADGHLVVGASVDIRAGKRERLTVPTGVLCGPHRVYLRTQMVAGSLTNHQVRSYWLSPRFHGDLSRCETPNDARPPVRSHDSAPSGIDETKPGVEIVLRILDHGGGKAEHDRIPVRWSESYRDNLRRISRNEVAGRASVDPILSTALLRCTDDNFMTAERVIIDLLRDNLETCLRGGETFISFLGALFVVQRFDLVAALLRARYGFGRELEIDVRRGGPGRARIRWDILPSGAHRFIFDAQAFESDQTRNEILLFQWEFPVFANYSRQRDQETGSVFINHGDVGQTPGLAYCDSRPDYFLIPDYIFVPSGGYGYARQILRANRMAWQDRAPVAFWRGSTTGVPASPDNWRSLERIKLCELGRRHADSGLIDVGISSTAQFTNPEVVREINESGLVRGPVPWEQWGRYKYQIDIDGNSSPWSNLFQKLLTGNPVLKVESSRGMRQWYYDELIPWRNYVPIAPDMSDLMSKISWLVRNDTTARRIGEAGLALAEHLTYEREIRRSVGVISAAFRYFNGQPEGADPFGRSTESDPADSSGGQPVAAETAPPIAHGNPGSNKAETGLFDVTEIENGGVVVDGRHGHYYATYQSGGDTLTINTIEKIVAVVNVDGRAVVSWPATVFDTGQPTELDIGLPCHVPGAGASGGDFVSPIIGVSNDFVTVKVTLRDPAPTLLFDVSTKLTWPCFLSPAWSAGNPAWTDADHHGGDVGKGIRISEGQTWKGGDVLAFGVRKYQCPVIGTITGVIAPNEVALSIAYGAFGYSVSRLPGVEIDWGTDNSARLRAAAEACVLAGYSDLYFSGPRNGIVFAIGCHTPISPNSPENFPELKGSPEILTTAGLPAGIIDADSHHLWQNTRWISDGVRSRVFSYGGAEVYKQICPRAGPPAPPPRPMILGRKHLKRLNSLIEGGAMSATVVNVSASIFADYPTGSGQPLQNNAISIVRSWLQAMNGEIALNFVDRGIGGASITWMEGVAEKNHPHWYETPSSPWWSYCDPVPVNRASVHGDVFLLFGDGSNDIWQISALSMLSLRRKYVAAVTKVNGLPPDILMTNCRSRSHTIANNGQWVSLAAGHEFAATLLETLAENLNIGFYDLFHPSMLLHDGWSPRHMTSRGVEPPPPSMVTPNAPYDCRYQGVRDYSGWFTIGASCGAEAWISGQGSVGRLHFTLSSKPDNQFIVGTDGATGNLAVMATTFGRWMTDRITLDPVTGVLTASGVEQRIVSDITWQMFQGGVTFYGGESLAFSASDIGLPMLVSNAGYGGIPYATQIVDVLAPHYIELADRLPVQGVFQSGTVLTIGGALFCVSDADAALDVVIFQGGTVHQGKIRGYTSSAQVITNITGAPLSEVPATVFVGHLSAPWTVTGVNVSDDPHPNPAVIFSKRYNRISLACSSGTHGGVAENTPKPVWSGNVTIYGGPFCPKVFVANGGPCTLSAAAFAIDQKLLFSAGLSDLRFWGTGDGHYTEGGLGVHPTAAQVALLDEVVASRQNWSAAD